MIEVLMPHGESVFFTFGTQMSQSNSNTRRNILVLWHYKVAANANGEYKYGSDGNQMRRIKPGDRLFVCATLNSELLLAGAIEIERIQHHRQPDPNRFGDWTAWSANNVTQPFQMIPLRKEKWRLRFESKRDRLSRKSAIGGQLQANRILTPESATLLVNLLKKSHSHRVRMKPIHAREGKLLTKSVSVRERDQRLRSRALHVQGRSCRICEIDFEAAYGPFARNCIQVHHLHELGARGERGSRTREKDLIVVCPNCHGALHASDDAGNWQALRRKWLERNGRD